MEPYEIVVGHRCDIVADNRVGIGFSIGEISFIESGIHGDNVVVKYRRCAVIFFNIAQQLFIKAAEHGADYFILRLGYVI